MRIRNGAYKGAHILVSACAGVLLCIAPASHALDAIDTDGPDFVESSEVVPRGHFQYEIDLNAERNRRVTPHNSTVSTPALLKYGFAENFEFRLAPDGYIRENKRAGRGDTALGIKWHAQDRDAKKGVAAVSWIAHIDTPSGGSQLRKNGARPSLRSVITWELPHDLALGLMPGLKYDVADDGHRYAAAILGMVLNKRINERWRAFVEFSGRQIAHAADGGVVASWDIGAAWLASNDTQIGARAGIAANGNSPNHFVLFEIAQRF